MHQSQSEQSGEQIIHENEILLEKFISPPNPITTKILNDNEQQQQRKNKDNFTRFLNQSNQRAVISYLHEQQLSLQNLYGESQLIFGKYPNQNKNLRNQIKYLSSIFVTNLSNLSLQLKYQGMLKQDNFLQFDSNYQSANLFQVYKTGERQYDLVLQNDLNTTGYAQWFNFKVRNKVKNVKVKFNIVNLYKSSSLYQRGMKPLSLSKFDYGKWQQDTQQVQYYENRIPMQRNRNKNYHTLSFCYEFRHQSDEVQICHFYPYTTKDCHSFMSNINDSKKVRIKNIGNSVLKKAIPLIHIFSGSERSSKKKKAIVIIGRQHPGQTQSSFLIQEMVRLLLANNNDSQSEFILDKFDVYICPMLNIDGVSLGNYRTNAYGYDLNRFWHTQDQLKTPQIYNFKKFINSLKKRQPISLILDLHGHSSKLNSFFFGNPYGKNYMMLPFIASKMCDMIRFKSCIFRQEKSQKSKTARATFGSLLKDTTYFYTFQVSFWGYRKNGRVFPFTSQSLKLLSKSLLSAIYKVFLQENKEETAKQSVYFKQIRKQLYCLVSQLQYFQKQTGSDSEAEELTLKEQSQRQRVDGKGENQQSNEKNNQGRTNIKDFGVQVNIPENNIHQSDGGFVCTKFQNDSLGSAVEQNLKKIREKSRFLMPNKQMTRKQQQKLYRLAYSQKNQTKKNISRNNNINSISRKQFLLQRLRIFGQTFVQQPQQNKQANKKGISIQVPDLDDENDQMIHVSSNRIQASKSHFPMKQVNSVQSHNHNKEQKERKTQTRKRNNLSTYLTRVKIQDVISCKHQNPSIKKQQNHGNASPLLLLKISKQPLVRITRFKSVDRSINNNRKMTCPKLPGMQRFLQDDGCKY